MGAQSFFRPSDLADPSPHSLGLLNLPPFRPGTWRKAQVNCDFMFLRGGGFSPLFVQEPLGNHTQDTSPLRVVAQGSGDGAE